MRRFIIFICSVVSFNIGFSQYSHFGETTYTAFNNTKHDVYILEGKFTVLLITKNILRTDQFKDTTVLFKIRDEVDAYYQGYKNLFGIEPPGGNPNFQNKANVFFGQPSCGAGCGLLGAKGVEIGSNFLSNIYNEIKFNGNIHPMVIVGYEFGRNFFTLGSKILFPFDVNKKESNGGFAEGFANLGYLEAYKDFVSPKFDANRIKFQETDIFHSSLKKLFLEYINDLTKNPYNSLVFEKFSTDFNRNPGHAVLPAYNASGILIGTYHLFNKPSLNKFVSTVAARENASTKEYAMGSIALGFAKSINLDLNNYFTNVIKFNYDEKARNEISTLPKILKDKLIKDLDLLYFATPFDSIQLNIRSINYDSKNNNVKYVITLDGTTYSSSSHGNNIIPYSILGTNIEKIVKVSLFVNSIEIDSYQITLKKRKRIEAKEILSSGKLYSTNGTGRITQLDSNTIKIENTTYLTDNPQFDNNILWSPYPLFRDRTIKFSSLVKNVSISKDPGFSRMGIMSRFGRTLTGLVGKDIGIGDTTNFYNIFASFNVNDFHFKSEEEKSYKFLNMDLALETIFSNTTFKDFYIEDITDTDKDGFMDFDDKCPSTAGVNDGCPVLTNAFVKEYDNSLKIFPNPTQEFLNIELPDSKDLLSNNHFKLFDISGKFLGNYELKDAQFGIYTLNTSNLNNGTYILHLKTMNKTHLVKFSIVK